MAKQEQACFQPGAALWFLLVNYGKASLEWFRKQPGIAAVHPFGIYVSGHTHTGDLVTIKFDFEKAVRDRKAGKALSQNLRRRSADKFSEQVNAQDQAEAFQKQRAAGSSVVELEWLKPRP